MSNNKKEDALRKKKTDSTLVKLTLKDIEKLLNKKRIVVYKRGRSYMLELQWVASTAPKRK